MPKRKADSKELQGCVQPPPAVRRSTPLTNLQSQVPTQAIQVASKDNRRITSPNGTRDLPSLPKEIKDEIWSEVLGDRTIHLRYTDPSTTYCGGGGRPTVQERALAKWEHYICVADLSEQAICQQSIRDGRGIRSRDCGSHHYKCYGQPWHGKEKKPPTLDLRLLRTNHQIHDEASTILLRTNLFSIHDEKCFVHFMQTLDPARKAMLAKLHLSFTWQPTIDGLFEAPRSNPNLNPWSRHMPATLIAQLSGLHTLHICMAQGSHSEELLGEMKRMGLSWVAGLLRFGDHEAGAPVLKTVTVSLTDEEWDRLLRSASWAKKRSWTLRERQEFAEKVRQRILNT
jgi:hypothetical protein